MRKLIVTLILTPIIFILFTTNVKADVLINRWNITLTSSEVYMLAQILELEDGNDTYDSKCAVVETIFNRMESELYPNTLEEVLSQKGQFSTWKIRDKATPSADTYKVIYDVLYGLTNVLEKDRTKFNNKPIGYDPIKIGGHYYGLQNKREK